MDKSNQKTDPQRLKLAALLLAVLLVASDPAGTTDLATKARSCSNHLGLLPVAEGQALSPPLEILSWNIQKASNQGWMEDLLALGGDRNLTFIQEAALHAQLGELQPTGPLYQSFAEGYITSSQRTGVMTLSTHAPTMQCNFTRSEPWLGTPKAAAVTEHALIGSEARLLAINLHAVNFTFGIADLNAQLSPLAELLSSHHGPAILAGDFNTWSDSRQRLVDETLSGLGLVPLSFEPDLRTTAFGRPLDHIYVRGLIAEHTEVVPVTSSDHNALRARLSLRM
ncbi:endonuclease/exonuclease/phosphatase family protein [Pseudohalioglobus lutimaris]|uniref:EEP domain-containing protein n=1 Tax=Pseudohalioglobus lutimaris TaxID=1737061 RepID=A0A2N5X0J9_9GAMM|nr:endonuclease/exonuclease/phosphatase family protein [Pseudohalioglobus lutimaris]PLW67976.1 EEP domain-containing protein [Pseudohalioglobus lutimaris]